MLKEILLKSSNDASQIVQPNLPSFAPGIESTMKSGKSFQVDGTNVVRVPFGIRQPRRKRPVRPERWATLVLPLQPGDSPNPPPQAA